MADHARSDDPAVQAQLDRLPMLSPGRDMLGLERITAHGATRQSASPFPRCFTSQGPTAKGRPAPFSALHSKRRARPSMSIPARIWCASMSGSASRAS